MLGDVLTKALPKPKHQFCVEVIGLTIPNPKVGLCLLIKGGC